MAGNSIKVAFEILKRKILPSTISFLCWRKIASNAKVEDKTGYQLQLFPNSKRELTLMTAPKTIILTGSFLPEKFKDSDADFNLGFAIGAVMSYRTLQGYTSIVGLTTLSGI